MSKPMIYMKSKIMHFKNVHTQNGVHFYYILFLWCAARNIVYKQMSQLYQNQCCLVIL